MPFNLFTTNHRYFVPQIIQTSSMDCGPAALKAVLEGFHISVNYDRLRKACLTNASGTSIDIIEDIAVQMGLDAEQVVIQKDHFLLKETKALPAIVVVRLADGYTHVVVAWRTYGQLVQIMDPAVGRIWMHHDKFLDMLYPFSYDLDVETWKEYTETEIFCDPLYRRMSDLNISHGEIIRLINAAQKDKDWRAMATLDASVRILKTIHNSGNVLHNGSSEKIFNTFYESAMNKPLGEIIPEEYFSVYPSQKDETNFNALNVRGALLIHIAGKNESTYQQKSTASDTIPLIHDKHIQPEKEFYQHVFSDNRFFSMILLIALGLASFNISIEALILMGFMSIGSGLTHNLDYQSFNLFSIFLFFVAVFFLECPINAAKLQIGRRFEISTRLKFLLKIPKLEDHYFSSRTHADIAQRIHDMRLIRKMPEILISIFKYVFQIFITVSGIIWLMPTMPVLPIIIGLIAVSVPILAIPFLKEKDLQFRIFTGALAQFCLDALTGLTPLRSHHAENAIRYEQESILCKWKKSGIDYFLVKLSIIGCGIIVNCILSIALIYNYIMNAGNNACIFLLIYWVLNLSDLGIQLANAAGTYPGIRNRILRIFEPIHTATNEKESENRNQNAKNLDNNKPSGMAIDFKNVSVLLGDQTILSDIDFSVKSGEHVAIIGESGAGKSSLMKLLLGFYSASSGEVSIDKKNFTENIQSTRREMAWIDPSVHIWNKPLFENITYGSTTHDYSQYGLALDQAGLINLLNNLPEKDKTRLGEAGKLVSGGEGQRVRLGRAWYKKNVRCVILDEPFRGIGRHERHSLLNNALEHWKSSTLFFISHDVSETMRFNRVLVIKNGKIVEDASPDSLLKIENSNYKAMIDKHQEVHEAFRNTVQWKKIWIEKGRLRQG
jgi:ATP-binding cassette subfamily B protein